VTEDSLNILVWLLFVDDVAGGAGCVRKKKRKRRNGKQERKNTKERKKKTVKENRIGKVRVLLYKAR